MIPEKIITCPRGVTLVARPVSAGVVAIEEEPFQELSDGRHVGQKVETVFLVENLEQRIACSKCVTPGGCQVVFELQEISSQVIGA